MPSWVLLVTRDSLALPRIEEAVRLAGFSPRRAPDLERTRVLLRQGEQPAAAVVDLVSTGEDGLGALRELDGRVPLIGIAASSMIDLSARTGAVALRGVPDGVRKQGTQLIEPDEVTTALPALLERLAPPPD